MPTAPSTDSNTNRPMSAGLLQTIEGDQHLLQRLASMPADEKTVEVSAVNGFGFSHPEVKLGNESETVLWDSSVPLANGSGVASTASGFVPLRNVASLGNHGNRQQADSKSIEAQSQLATQTQFATQTQANPHAQSEPEYRLVGELGSGGTGIVFQAHQRAVDREVAVKMLRSDLATNGISRERFLAEARVIGGLDHPNVIALHEVYSDEDGALYYSMKRIDGDSWDKLIGEMTPQQNVETLLHVADAIRYAHSRGLIHRDIKPENVMLGRFGEVLLADWGLAVNENESGIGEDIHQSIGGTPAYMAPELAGGQHQHIVRQSDVYLLGATLFQILAGFPPHHGDSLLQCIQNAAGNVIQQTDVESELMDVAMKAMRTDPADRYQSVDDFIHAIKAHRQHEQSTRLLKRAAQRINDSTGDDPYHDYNVADALLTEAINVWPENERAITRKKQYQFELGAIATKRGDLELAASIFDSIDASDTKEGRVVKDLQARRDASRQKVSRYSALFMNAPNPGLLIQVSTRKIVEANDAFAQLFGFERAEIVGRAINELNLWACPERRKELTDRLEAEGEVDEFEAKLLSRDGRPIEISISSRVATIDGDEMMVSTLRDISLRKAAEDQLKRSQQRLRDMQHLAGLATWTYDVESDQLKWSNETYELLGRDRDAGTPSRKEYIEMIHPDDRGVLKQAVDTAIDSGAAYEIRIRQRVADGTYQDVVVRGQPIFDDEGNTIEVYGVLMPR